MESGRVYRDRVGACEGATARTHQWVGRLYQEVEPLALGPLFEFGFEDARQGDPACAEFEGFVDESGDHVLAASENVHEMSATYLDALGRRYVSRGSPGAGRVFQVLDDGSEFVVYDIRR